MERFFHVRLPSKPSKGGATVRVKTVPSDSKVFVRVQVALCSQDDQFWRAMGRLTTKAKSGKVYPLEDLPKVLQGVYEKVQRMAGTPKNKLEQADFDYATKHFLPKE